MRNIVVKFTSILFLIIRISEFDAIRMDEIENRKREKSMSETKLFSNSKKVKYLYKISKFKFCYHIYITYLLWVNSTKL